MKKYILFSGALTVILLLCFYFLNDLLFKGYLHPLFYALTLFFFVQSFVVGWMLSSAENDKERFPIYALGSVAFRFLTGVMFLIIFILLEVPDPVPLVIQFMGVYLIYLVFELYLVLANLRRNSG